jgi:hypothetical protein
MGGRAVKRMPASTLPMVGLLAFVGVACTTPSPVTVAVPVGFAAYELRELQAGPDVQLAVSPEGVLFRVRAVANQPPQGLAFWTEALRTQLGREGYTFVDSRELASSLGVVAVLRWSAPVGNADWFYLTALAAVGEQLVVAEAAGDIAVFQEYEPAVLASLESLAAAGSPALEPDP